MILVWIYGQCHGIIVSSLTLDIYASFHVIRQLQVDAKVVEILRRIDSK